MIILFSEYKSDYPHYIFPYAIWALPEAGEQPADLFGCGFLPSSRFLDRYYLCRQIRVPLDRFQPSSENRRILRKGQNYTCRLLTRGEFVFSEERRTMCKAYADARFGRDVMSYERLDNLFSAPIISHLLVVTESGGKEIGFVVLFMQEPAMAYYYYSFYNLDYFSNNLGMFMMTRAVQLCSEKGFQYLYLGTCYNNNALYKTQFKGVQFFNGFSWSDNLDELKYILDRDGGSVTQHLLETEVFQNRFLEQGLQSMKEKSLYRLRLDDQPVD